jgi:linoleoyl-CoA desaturase
MLFSLHWIFVYDIQFLFKKSLANMRRIEHSRTEVGTLVLAKVTYIALALALPMARLSIPWTQVLLGFVVMHFCVSLVFVYSLIGTHFCEETSFPEVDADGYVSGSRVANFLLGGFNCHAAHHLFPDVCHVHYVAISAIIQETCQEYGVPYHVSPFFAMIRSHFRFLKRMGRLNLPATVQV